MNHTKQRVSILIATLACGVAGVSPVLGYDVWYVNGSLTTGQDDGSSWENAFRSTVSGVTPLRRAIDAAQEGDEVWVAQGTYKPAECVGSCSEAEQDMYFELKNGVKLLGGFAGCETCREQRNWRRYETVLRGDLLGNDDPDRPPSDEDTTRPYDNSYNVVRGAMNLQDILNTVIDGFTITGGYDQTGGLYPESGGGGIRFINDGNATVRHCKIVRNWALNGGGGIYSFGTLRAHIVECIIAENVASHGGGLAAKVVASPLITNCLVTGNLAYDSGAGLHFEGFDNVQESSTPNVVNTLVVRNVLNATGPSFGGAGIYATGNQTTLRLRNSTVAFNVVDDANPSPGGGLSVRSGADAGIDNTTFWGNSAGDGDQIHASSSNSVITNKFSNIQRLQVDDVSASSITYEHCIGTLQADDPQFRDPDGVDNVAGTWQDNDYTMLATSRSMDSASNALVAPGEADLDGDDNRTEPTPFDQRVSFRFVDNPSAPNCQIFPDDPQCDEPPPPIVDVGALEDLDCGSPSTCRDGDWCTIETCQTAESGHDFVPRRYGDVRVPDAAGCYDSSRFPNLDDILAVIACNNSDCDQCGYSGSGRKSNCDLVAGPQVCGQNGIINLDDILAVMAAFGGNYYCPACGCPEGDSLLAGDDAHSLTPTEVAEVLIDYLRSALPATDLDRRILETMGEALILWCSEEMNEAERAAVVELIPRAQGDAVDDLAAEILAVISAELAA